MKTNLFAIAILVGIVNADASKCTNEFTEIAAVDKVKADAKASAALSFKNNAADLLEKAEAKLPAAQKAVSDFEGDIATEEFQAATKEYNDAI